MNLDFTDVAFFKEHGYVVIENVFSTKEVEAMRFHLHATLKQCFALDHDAMVVRQETPLPPEFKAGVRGKGPVAQLFYPPWKMTAQDKVRPLAATLLDATFSSGREAGFTHPLGSSQGVNALPFIDHVAYRLPDHLMAEGGLSLHIDRNPHKPFAQQYFRPIQSSIALTDHYGGTCGGILLVPGFHREYDAFFASHIKTHPPEDGAFFRMHSRAYTAIQQRLQPVAVPAGSVLFWDNRLPHATMEHLSGDDTREAIFFSYLPDVPLNQRYHARQGEHQRQGRVPPAFGDGPEAWHALQQRLCNINDS